MFCVKKLLTINIINLCHTAETDVSVSCLLTIQISRKNRKRSNVRHTIQRKIKSK